MPNLFSRLLNKADEAIRRARALSVPPSPEALALEALNPLRGIGVTAAQDIFDAARRGNFATLGRVYAEIESADPTLHMVDGPGSQKPEPENRVPDAGGWTCPNCRGSEGNHGKFCATCGTPRPKEIWKCKCGCFTSGKFCPNCGEPKPTEK